MNHFSTQTRSLLTILAFFLLLPSIAGAQGPVLRGQVADPEGLPVAGITVSLHRVNDEGGMEVGKGVSDAAGNFEIEIDPALEGGVFFAATRFEGTLYMGEPFRSLTDLPAEYRVVVGEGGFAGGPAVQPAPNSAPDPADERRGLGVILIFAAIGIAAIGLPIIRYRQGPYRARRILVEIAELDEDFSSQPAETQAIEEPDYRARRAALYSRLEELAVATTDAARND